MKYDAAAFLATLFPEHGTHLDREADAELAASPPSNGDFVACPDSNAAPGKRPSHQTFLGFLATLARESNLGSSREAAIKLFTRADAVLRRVGMDHRHPALRDAVAMVVSALATEEIETIRLALAEFEVLVRRLAFPKSTGRARR